MGQGRLNQDQENSAFIFGEFRLDLRRQALFHNSQLVHLSPKSFKTLTYLVHQQGRTVSKEELVREVWTDTFVTDDSIVQAIKHIRQALCDDVQNPTFIRTVSKRGYCFIAEVKELPLDGKGLKTSQLSEDAETAPETEIVLDAQQEAVSTSTILSRSHFPTRLLSIGLSLAVLGLGGATLLWRMSVRAPTPRISTSRRLTNSPSIKFPPLATDGTRVYFTEKRDGHYSISQISAAGGEAVAISTPFQNVFLCDLSPDGSQLLIRSFARFDHEQGELWLVPLVGGAPRRLTDVPAFDGTWSPDGRSIVFTTTRDLRIANADGGNVRKLIEVHGGPHWPRWSPDGSYIRFTIWDSQSNANSLWEVSHDGRNLRRLFPAGKSSVSDCCGSWNPDGRYFLFQSLQDSLRHVRMIDERNGNQAEPVQLSLGPMTLRAPIVRKDGRGLLVVGLVAQFETVRYLPGNDHFVPMFAGNSIETLDFSSEGDWIAYTSMPGGVLWRSRLDGSDKVQLTVNPMRAAMPRWSPNGKEVAFMGRNPQTPWRVMVVSRDGENLREAVSGAGNQADPSWSPDGTSLAFGKIPALEESSDAVTIQMSSLKTHTTSTVRGSKGLFSPRWSPDGKSVVAISADSKKVVVLDLEQKQWSDLASLTEGSAGYPNWSRKGTYVYFLHFGVSDPRIVRVRVSDHKVERVSSLKTVRQPTTTFGAWVGLAPDDTPLVTRDLSSQQIYAMEWQTP